MQKCIGLFGTCGNSSWRKAFIEAYQKENINYFNPQVEADKWNDACAEAEAAHLIQDSIILFPVTSETYATASLAEIGFAIVQAILNPQRILIIFVDSKIDSSLETVNPQLTKEAMRERKLVIKHLKNINLKNVILVQNLEEMFNASICAYNYI